MMFAGPMAHRAPAYSGTFCPMASLLLAAFAAAASLLLAAGPAMAAEGVTRDIAGVSYTLPADWEEVEIPRDGFGAVEGGIEGLDSIDGLDECVAFWKDDGFFAGLSFGGEGVAGASLEDMEQVVADLRAAVSQVPDDLAGFSLEGLTFSAAMEQGCPTLTVYTDDIELNGVVYGLTLKLFSVEGAAGANGVVMLSLLPASGATTPDFEGSLPVLDAPRRFEFAAASYELPAGTRIAEGSVLGLDFMCATRDEAGLFGMTMLSPLSGPYASDDALLDELQATAESITMAFKEDPSLSGLFERVWAGAYRFAGLPTLGLEAVVDTGDMTERYVAVNTSVYDGGVSVVVFAEPLADGFAQAVLGSATAVGADGPVDGDFAAAADASASDDPRGFVVGIPG